MISRQSSKPSSDWSQSASDDTQGSQSKKQRRRRVTKSKRKLNRRLSMEGLEQRQLLAANPIGPILNIDTFDGPRNVGTVAAFNFNEREGSSEIGLNDSIFTAEQIPLGNLNGQRDTVDVFGAVGFEAGSAGGFVTDLDYFQFSLQAGDILDVAATGSVTSFNLFTPDGQVWVGQDAALDPALDFNLYPLESPLQTDGNVRLAQVAPFTGTYTVAVSAEGILSSYTLGLRTYRPVTESLPIGQAQTVFLDFDGGLFAREEFNLSLANPGLFTGGVFRVPPIAQSLEQAGLVALPQQYNAVAAQVTQAVTDQFNDLENYTGNGSFRLTGTPGDFGITVLNSFEHAEPVGVPFTRVVFGSQASFPEIAAGGGLLGLAQTIDVGNFDLSETVLVFLDNEVAFAAGVEHSAALSDFDVLGLEIGVTTTHELAHVFGAYHTDGTNLTPSIIDGGGALNEENGLGVGVDGILGTIDDVPVRFRTDFVDPGGAVTFGILYSGESMAHVLSTGTQGGGISGRVFEDLNGNGSSAGDPGLAGVTVFLDTNANGIQDATDPSAVTGTDGSFSLAAAAGTFNLFAITPSNFAATPFSVGTTTSVSQSVSVGSTNVEFGFTQVNPDITGKKFADLNNNGALDVGEPGIAGAYIYADLDGDNRPDLFEPFDITDEDGFYTLELDPIGREFAIREVEVPGFQRTIPLSGEWLVNYTGGPLGSSFNFGGLPSRDFGDAPDTYQTTIAANGASHGISDAVRIGASSDSELDGSPTVGADGDDFNQLDDEDGVVLVRPPSATLAGQYAVSLTNTSGSQGYLQGWVDFNADGDFLDAGEQIVSDGIFGTGTAIVEFTLPAGFDVNADGTTDGVLDTYSRFRYSTTPGLGVGGAADDGEVEDNTLRLNADGSLTASDLFNVPQNSQAFVLDVLANDLGSANNPLTILSAVSVNPIAAERGIVTVGTGTSGQQVLFYTPSRDFIGRDTLIYNVAGQAAFETVEVNVTFQTAAPIAIDDIFEVPSTESNFPLNVLDNDIASINGGLTIDSVTSGSAGGILALTPGDRGVRYTPASGFTGSEQFFYTIEDSAGQISTATATVVLTTQAFEDDKAEFKIEILDRNNDTELLTLQAGQTFRVRVSVDDILRADSDQIQGLQSAFTDLLYTAELVAPVESNPTDAFPFDITFGPKFESGGFQLGNTLKPGIFDEVGSTQSSNNLNTVGENPDLASHTGFAELFTITMRATGAGVAFFQTDPSDAVVSETILIDSFTPLTFGEITYGSVNIPIVPAGDGFPVALDDSFPTGVDSFGQTISSSSVASFDALDNDIVGPADSIIEFGLREAPTNGNATIDTRGTADPSDDIINYTPDPNFQGFDQFSYILTVDSAEFGTVRSVANVTLVVGANVNPQAQYDFTFVDEAGSPITSVAAGDRFGVRIDAIDVSDDRSLDAVFAGYLDILYNSNIIETIAVDNGGNPDLFDFDVEFDPQFLLNPAVGSNDRPGLIDEFGSNQGDLGGSGLTLATIYFTALQPGVATVTGSPADRFPFQDTLLDRNDNAVPIENIVYDSESIVVTAGVASGEPLHNADFPADVNGDNLVTAIDALIVINQMARSGAEGEFASNQTETRYFHDVNGDGHISAIDALRVINWLNKPDSGSSEPIAPVQYLVSDVESEPLTQVAEELSAQAKIVGGIDPSANSNEVSAVEVSSSDSSDDDDDLLGLLADDIANQWS